MFLPQEKHALFSTTVWMSGIGKVTACLGKAQLGLDSFQWCPVTGQGATGTNWSIGSSECEHEEELLYSEGDGALEQAAQGVPKLKSPWCQGFAKRGQFCAAGNLHCFFKMPGLLSGTQSTNVMNKHIVEIINRINNAHYLILSLMFWVQIIRKGLHPDSSPSPPN